jgi:TRAP-type C4-dicarboxylate transport system substrate-binding protein
MTDVKWTPLVGALVLTKRTWDAVPQLLHEPFMQAAEEAGRKLQAAGRLENDQAIATMKTKWQLEVHSLTPQLEAEWKAFAESVYPRIRGALVPADMFDTATRFVEEYRTGRPSGGSVQ